MDCADRNGQNESIWLGVDRLSSLYGHFLTCVWPCPQSLVFCPHVGELENEGEGKSFDRGEFSGRIGTSMNERRFEEKGVASFFLDLRECYGIVG